MAEHDFGGPEGDTRQDLVETGLASIIDEAAGVCERLSVDERLSGAAGGELRDVLGILHTMLDRAQELVTELAKELATARRPAWEGQGLSAGAVRVMIEQALAEQRTRQDTAIKCVHSYAEQIFSDMTWRVGMLGEQVEALAASLDAVKGTDAKTVGQGAVETALGAFEKEVSEFLALFRERAAKAGEAIAAAGREREVALVAMIERAERAAAPVITPVTAPEPSAMETKPMAEERTPDVVAKVGPKGNAPKSASVKKTAPKVNAKPPVKSAVTVKTRARSLRTAA